MAQPVGLVVEPVVLNRLGVFPESATTVLADWQQRLEQLLEDPLDVEQIGSVYEVIMGFRVEKVTGPSVGMT